MVKKDNDMNHLLIQTVSILEGRWTIFILWELLRHETRRFKDFQDAFPGMAPNTLSDRLRKLEKAGVIERKVYQVRPQREHYKITASGKDLEPIIDAMETWGNQYIE